MASPVDKHRSRDHPTERSGGGGGGHHRNNREGRDRGKEGGSRRDKHRHQHSGGGGGIEGGETLRKLSGAMEGEGREGGRRDEDRGGGGRERREEDRGMRERRGGMEGDEETRIRHQALTQWLQEHTAYGGTMLSDPQPGLAGGGENIHSAFGGGSKGLDSQRRGEDKISSMFGGGTMSDAQRLEEKMMSLFGGGRMLESGGGLPPPPHKDELRSPPSYKGRVTDSRKSDDLKDSTVSHSGGGSSRAGQDSSHKGSGHHRGPRVTDSHRGVEDKYQSPGHGVLRGTAAESQGLIEDKMRFTPSYGSAGVSDVHRLEDKIQSELDQVMGQRQRRRPRLDPSRLSLSEVNGDENVSVIDRASGKRMTGAKAPPLRHLAEWLRRHPGFDVDPKWAHIVRAKGNLPDDLQVRMPTPHGRGRRPAGTPSTPAAPSVSSPPADFFNAMMGLSSMSGGLMGQGPCSVYPKMGFPMGLGGPMGLGSPLGLGDPMGLASAMGLGGPLSMGDPMGMGGPLGLGGPFGLGGSMYAASLASLGLLPGLGGGIPPPGIPDFESRDRDDNDSDNGSKDRRRADKKNDSNKDQPPPGGDLNMPPGMSSLHPSFPYMFNPLLMNQMYAQSLAAVAGFGMPPGAAGDNNPFTSSLGLGHLGLPSRPDSRGGGSPSDNDEGRMRLGGGIARMGHDPMSLMHGRGGLSSMSATSTQNEPEDLSMPSKHQSSSGGRNKGVDRGEEQQRGGSKNNPGGSSNTPGGGSSRRSRKKGHRHERRTEAPVVEPVQDLSLLHRSPFSDLMRPPSFLPDPYSLLSGSLLSSTLSSSDALRSNLLGGPIPPPDFLKSLPTMIGGGDYDKKSSTLPLNLPDFSAPYMPPILTAPRPLDTIRPNSQEGAGIPKLTREGEEEEEEMEGGAEKSPLKNSPPVLGLMSSSSIITPVTAESNEISSEHPLSTSQVTESTPSHSTTTTSSSSSSSKRGKHRSNLSGLIDSIGSKLLAQKEKVESQRLDTNAFIASGSEEVGPALDAGPTTPPPPLMDAFMTSPVTEASMTTAVVMDVIESEMLPGETVTDVNNVADDADRDELCNEESVTS